MIRYYINYIIIRYIIIIFIISINHSHYKHRSYKFIYIYIVMIYNFIFFVSDYHHDYFNLFIIVNRYIILNNVRIISYS